jgi:hypothetical protein
VHCARDQQLSSQVCPSSDRWLPRRSVRVQSALTRSLRLSRTSNGHTQIFGAGSHPVPTVGPPGVLALAHSNRSPPPVFGLHVDEYGGSPLSGVCTLLAQGALSSVCTLRVSTRCSVVGDSATSCSGGHPCLISGRCEQAQCALRCFSNKLLVMHTCQPDAIVSQHSGLCHRCSKRDSMC